MKMEPEKRASFPQKEISLAIPVALRLRIFDMTQTGVALDSGKVRCWNFEWVDRALVGSSLEAFCLVEP